MKNLRQYQQFNHKQFLRDNDNLVVKSVSEWEDFTTKQKLGTKITLTVMNPESSNFLESFTVKTIQNLEELLLKKGNRVSIFNITKSSIYGDYQNNLSMEASIKVWERDNEQVN